MVLGNIFKKGDSQETELFWSLVIGDSWVESGIWRVVDEKAEVIAQGGIGSWQEGDDESLVSACDSSLSAAAASLEEDVKEPSKVVFGLPSSWSEEGSIQEDRLRLLKKLSQELELTPAGFVAIPESIVHFLKVKEGAPPNCLLVGLSEDSIEVALVYNGKMLGTVEVARSISLGADVAEGLARLPDLDQYPSRILLYNHRAENLDEARQNLIDAEWKDSKVTFLHTPKVEILPEDIGVSAVSLAGGAEVGHAKTVVLPKDEEDSFGVEEEKSAESEESNEEVAPEKELREVSPEELGFLQGADVASSKPQTVNIGEQVTSKDEIGEGQIPAGTPPQPQELPVPSGQDVRKEQTASLLSKVSGIFSGLSLTLPSFSFGGGGMRLLIIAGVGLILLFLAGILAYWYLPKAKVTIYVSPEKLEKSLEFGVDPKLSVVDNANKIVPGKVVESIVSGEKTTSTSGAKTIGDRAKGQVIIHHVGAATILKSGTVLLGPNGLKFILDESASVATGSSITNAAKVPASVTAADIGAQYNLAGTTEFSVGNFSKADFVAQNTEALSGGTSRSVAAVSEEDRDTLTDELTRELLERGIEELKKDAAEGEVLVEDSVYLRAVENSFSHKLGEETTTLKLTINADIVATALLVDGVESLINSEIEKDVPEGFTLRPDQIEITYKRAEVAEDEEETSALVAEIKANLLPKVNPDEIAEAIAGKYPPVAKEYLATIPGFARVEISFSLKLPGKLGTLPRLSDNIIIEVAAER